MAWGQAGMEFSEFLDLYPTLQTIEDIAPLSVKKPEEKDNGREERQTD